MRKRIYVAGPYSADNQLALGKNIKDGTEAAVDVFAGLRQAPHCPWLDFQYIHHFSDDDYENITVNDFYEAGLAWLEVAEALLVIGKFWYSSGTLAEIKFATEHHIPVFYGILPLIKWLDEQPDTTDNNNRNG